MQTLNRTYESGETVFLSAEVSDLSDDLNGGTNRGVIESVQFFANGRPIYPETRSTENLIPPNPSASKIRQSPYFTGGNQQERDHIESMPWLGIMKEIMHCLKFSIHL